MTKQIDDAEPPLPVIFRIEKDGDVTALFPTEPADYDGRTMTCFAHIGQHSGASWEWARRGRHRPATPTEYAALKAELESPPYNYRLKVYKRITSNLRDQFNAEVRRLGSI